MSDSFLLAAEADKIQDFVFRAARLRQVTGGSALLTRFCQQVPRKCLGLADDAVVVADGGAFRLLFTSETAALEAGRELADLYYMATGCGLSVARPVAVGASGFGAANEQAGLQLRAAKLSRAPQAVAHLPYMAFCASTGVELASAFRPAKGGAREKPNYLSLASEYKRRESATRGKEAFIEEFIRSVDPEREPSYYRAPEDADMVGRVGGYDERDYVAYLIADGNGIGALFGRCRSADGARQLSQGLSKASLASLAAPTRQLMKHSPRAANHDLVPVLPLIIGGDDLFALLPASYALSFAQQFCLAFEREMAALLAQIPDLAIVPTPTIAIAVVICKAKYPFQLAYQRGRVLLKAAKRLCKSGTGRRRSAVNFEVIIGSRLEDASRAVSIRRPTLRPYWADAATSEGELAIPLDTLLVARDDLRALPQKRQAQLRAAFDAIAAGGLEQVAALTALVGRIGLLAPELAEPLHSALARLGGDAQNHYQQHMERGADQFSGHALPDLLDAWDFLLDLKHPPVHYREQYA